MERLLTEAGATIANDRNEGAKLHGCIRPLITGLGQKRTRPERMCEPYKAKPPGIDVFSEPSTCPLFVCAHSRSQNSIALLPKML